MSFTESNIGFISLGCPKALVDSERILTRLKAEGYRIVPTYRDADLVVVNTCGFIDSAVTESLETIGEALEENGKVIVTGCLGARADQILEVHPNVLAVTGPQAYEAVITQVHQHLPRPAHPFTSLIPPQGIKLTPRHYAYLKIAEGCDHRCSFCIIPQLRGNQVSYSVDQILQEAEGLVEAGVKELLIISQDTSAYGVDVKYRTGFWKGRPVKTHIQALAEALGELGIWIRLHYVYPYPHVDHLIPLMTEGKLLPYLDVPLQHASPRILKAMKRPANSENTLERIRRWREICPNITLRSTFIVGFPGETEADFQQLLVFLEEAQLDRVGCFSYSPVEGAPANQLPNAVPEDVKQDRLERFMLRQAELSTSKLQQKRGRTLTVLVDAIEGNQAIARSQADAPEIDGLVYVQDSASLRVGEFAQVTVLDTDTYDLYAEPCL
jgi:ribosomal protein S12 methylthiotransferase